MSVKDAREAENEAEQIVKSQTKSRFGVTPSSVRIDATNLDETASVANYVIRGRVTLIAKPKGFFSAEETVDYTFQTRIDAKELKLLGFEWRD